MKHRSRITVGFLFLLVAATFFVFRSATRPSQLTAFERSFVGTWDLQTTGDKIVFKNNRTWHSAQGEFSSYWRIDNGTIFFKTWRDEPQTFDNDLANSITKPIVNTWDSVFADEESWELVIVDETTAKIRNENNIWQTLQKSV